MAVGLELFPLNDPIKAVHARAFGDSGVAAADGSWEEITIDFQSGKSVKFVASHYCCEEESCIRVEYDLTEHREV